MSHDMIKDVCVGREDETNDRSSVESGRVLDVHAVGYIKHKYGRTS